LTKGQRKQSGKAKKKRQKKKQKAALGAIRETVKVTPPSKALFEGLNQKKP